MLLDFAGFLIDELDFDLQRSGISSISRLAFIDAVLFFLEIVFAEMQRPFMSTILDRRNIRKYIPQPFFTEPFVRFGLQIEQMGHPQNFLRSGVGISFLVPTWTGLNILLLGIPRLTLSFHIKSEFPTHGNRDEKRTRPRKHRLSHKISCTSSVFPI